MKESKQIKHLKKIIKLKNYSMIFIVIFMIGLGMNFTAVVENNGKMPVKLDYSFNDKHHFSYNDEKVNYPLFTDIIPIGDLIFSFGDLIMFISIIFLIIIAIYQGVLLRKYY